MKSVRGYVKANRFFGGSIPINVLSLRATARLVGALDVIAIGTFA